jgi:hypothetical protein
MMGDATAQWVMGMSTLGQSAGVGRSSAEACRLPCGQAFAETEAVVNGEASVLERSAGCAVRGHLAQLGMSMPGQIGIFMGRGVAISR